MREDFNTVIELIKDIDFQKTQLLYNLYNMFDFYNNYDLSYDLNPFCNNVYFYNGKYKIEIIEIDDEDDVILFDDIEPIKQVLETPSFQCSKRIVKNDKYVALKNQDGDWMVMSIEQGEFTTDPFVLNKMNDNECEEVIEKTREILEIIINALRESEGE